MRGVWTNTFGLLVEDGSLAVGILVALAIVWVAAASFEARRDLAGWLLLLLLAGLLLVNLGAAGRSARRKSGS